MEGVSMERFEQAWKLGDLSFHVIRGDLFQVPADAIVNSEQSDFVLSWDPDTISGQIRRRYGDDVQRELSSATQRQILPVGTVLTTSGGGDYGRIYHAGFHHPRVFLASAKEDSQTEHVGVIRSCVRQILEELKGRGIRSIAFPLIGCGVFQLDPALLAYEFMAEVAQFANSVVLPETKDVWLVVYESELVQEVVNALVQALIDRVPPSSKYEPLALGVGYLDLFEQKVLRSNHPRWSTWLLVRYCELLTWFLFAHLAVVQTPSVTPQQIIESDRPASFGVIREAAAKLAKTPPLGDPVDEWPRFFAKLVRRDCERGRRLEQINVDRNNIAHGRQFRDFEQIHRDVRDLVCLSEWQELAEHAGSPDIEGLTPWIRRTPSTAIDPSEQVGILEKWGAKRWAYVVPHTGSTFKISSSEV